MTFDPTKPVQTRDGRKARIICTDANNTQSIVALITEEDGREYSQEFTKNGFYSNSERQTEIDLINIPERMIRWKNVYALNGNDGGYLTQEKADENAGVSRVGILKLTYENNKLVDYEYVMKMQPTHYPELSP